MKKKYYLFALATLLLGACTNEDDLVNRGDPGIPSRDGRYEVKFNIDGVANGVVPYAGEALATAMESEMKTLDIYVFGEDTLPSGAPKANAKMLLEEIFKSGVSDGMTLNQAGGKNEANISVYGKNKKYFYFVANGRSIASLQEFTIGVTDTTAFKAKVTDYVPGKITCPLLMTAIDSVKIDAVTNPLAVSLKRVVARFDIVNYGADADFNIEYIRIQQGRPQAYLFHNNLKPYETAPLKDFLYDSEKIDFLSATNANAGVTPSAFYMYPSVTTDKGMIMLGGRSIAGSPNLYEVRFQKDQDTTKPNNINIMANSRYVINIKTLGTNIITAKLTVNEWGVNDTIPVAGGYGSLALSLDSLVKTEGVSFAENTLTLPAEPLEDAMKIYVKASSKWVVASAEDWLEIEETSAADSVAEYFTVKPTFANVSKAGKRVGTVVVRNRERPSITQTLVVEQTANATNYVDVTAASNLHNGILSIDGETAFELIVDASEDWTSSTKAGSWITATAVTRAATNNTVNLTFAENTTDDVRIDTVTLTLTAKNTTHKRYITVSQAKRNLGIITVTASGLSEGKLPVDAKPVKEVTLTLKAKTAWKSVVPEGDTWVKLAEPTDTTSLNYNSSFKLGFDENTGTTERKSKIRFQNTKDPDNIFFEFEVTQAGAAITIDDISNVTIPAAAATDQLVPVTGNDTWTVAANSEATWITSIAPGVDFNEGNIVYSIEENTTPDDRVATITVTGATAPAVVKTFKITQKGVEAPLEITVGVDNSTVAIAADDITTASVVAVTVTNAVDATWSVSADDESWLTITPNTEAGTITITASSANALETERVAVLTVKSTEDESKTATITVTQAGII